MRSISSFRSIGCALAALAALASACQPQPEPSATGEHFRAVSAHEPQRPRGADDQHRYVVGNPLAWCDDELGCAHTGPVALTIKLEEKALEVACNPNRIGERAKRALFPQDPEFDFTVVFASAKPDFFRKSDYANPDSHWFNVFYGYYDVVVPAEMGHPFGYREVDGEWVVHFEDIVRIGKADWNYFSNHVYGVPNHVVEHHNDLDMGDIESDAQREKIGDYEFDKIHVANTSVVSGYTSAHGEKWEIFDLCLTEFWRFLFGTHHSVEGHDASFPPTRMRAKGWMCFAPIEEGGWRTHIFGGTVNLDYEVDEATRATNARFMDRQLEALRSVIEADETLTCAPDFAPAGKG